MKTLKIISFFSLVLVSTAASAACPAGTTVLDIKNADSILATHLYAQLYTQVRTVTPNSALSGANKATLANFDNWGMSVIDKGTSCTYTLNPTSALSVGSSIDPTTAPAVLPIQFTCVPNYASNAIACSPLQ